MEMLLPFEHAGQRSCFKDLPFLHSLVLDYHLLWIVYTPVDAFTLELATL